MSDPAEIERGPKDCIACRVTGTVALSGSGAYVLYQNRNLPPAAQASPFGKRLMNVVGVGK